MTIILIYLLKLFSTAYIRGPLLTWSWSPAWISDHMPSKVRDGITYPFPNFNGCAIEVWEWIRNFTQHFIMDVIRSPARILTSRYYVYITYPSQYWLASAPWSGAQVGRFSAAFIPGFPLYDLAALTFRNWPGLGPSDNNSLRTT